MPGGALSESAAVAAVERIIARNAQQRADAPVVNVKELEDRFAYAKAKGVSRPIRLSLFVRLAERTRQHVGDDLGDGSREEP